MVCVLCSESLRLKVLRRPGGLKEVYGQLCVDFMCKYVDTGMPCNKTFNTCMIFSVQEFSMTYVKDNEFVPV